MNNKFEWPKQARTSAVSVAMIQPSEIISGKIFLFAVSLSFFLRPILHNNSILRSIMRWPPPQRQTAKRAFQILFRAGPHQSPNNVGRDETATISQSNVHEFHPGVGTNGKNQSKIPNFSVIQLEVGNSRPGIPDRDLGISVWTSP